MKVLSSGISEHQLVLVNEPLGVSIVISYPSGTQVGLSCPCQSPLWLCWNSQEGPSSPISLLHMEKLKNKTKTHTPHWCFDSDALNLEMNLRGSDIFITFELPIYAHAISLYLFTSSLISFSDIYSSLCKRLVYLLKFTPR